MMTPPAARLAACSEAGCFHMNLGFVPTSAGLGWGPKPTALLDGNRKKRGSLKWTPSLPCTFRPIPQGTPDVQERGV